MNIEDNIWIAIFDIGKKNFAFYIEEIKEAITRQDILDLIKDKAIVLREIKGRKVNEKKGKDAFDMLANISGVK